MSQFEAANSLDRIEMSQNLRASLQRAIAYAHEQSHRRVTLEHLLLALADDREAAVILESSAIGVPALITDVSGYLGQLDDRMADGERHQPELGGDVRHIIQSAGAAAQKSQRRAVSSALVLAAIVGDGRSPAAQMLRNHGLTFENAIAALKQANAAAAARPVQPQSAPVQQPDRPTPGAVGASLQPPPAVAPEPTPSAPTASAPKLGPSVTAVGTTGPGAARLQNMQAAHEIIASARERIAAARGSVAARTAEAQAQSDRSIEPETAPEAPPSPPAAAEQEIDAAAAPSSQAARPPAAREASSEAPSHEMPATAPAPAPEPAPPAPPPAMQSPPAQQQPTPPAAGPDAAAARQPAAMNGAPPHSAHVMGGAQMPTGAPPAELRMPPATQPPQQQARPVPPPDHSAAHPGPPAAQPQPFPPQPMTSPPANANPTARAAGQLVMPPQRKEPPQTTQPTQPPPPPGPGFNRYDQPSPTPGAPGVQPVSQLWPTHPDGDPGEFGGAPRYQQSPQTSAGPEYGLPPSDVRPIEPEKLAEDIPVKMRTGVPTTVEIRAPRARLEAWSGGSTDPRSRDEQIITKAMVMRLKAPEGGFTIEIASPETQWSEGYIGPLSDDVVSWRWIVTPTGRGRRLLQLNVSTRVVGRDGLAAARTLPEQLVTVRVAPNYTRLAGRLAVWVVLATTGVALGYFGEGLFSMGSSMLAQVVR